MTCRNLALASALVLGFSLRAFAQDAPHVHGSDAGAAVPLNQPHPVDPNPPTPSGKMLTLPLAAGGTALAYVAQPKKAATGAVLVLHEWWGLNDFVKSHADDLAEQGYLVLAVDLYNGTVATTPDEAGKLMQGLDPAHAAAVEKAGIAWLKANVHGKKIATGPHRGGGEAQLPQLRRGPCLRQPHRRALQPR